MAQGKGRGGPQEPPQGKIRLSQLVTTFGPGAMVDLIDHAVLIGGLDFWRFDPSKPVRALDEPRLRERVAPRARALGIELAKENCFRTGPPGDDSAPTYRSGIHVAEFPTWFICQECRALEPRRNLEKKGNKYRHQCSRTKASDCVPVRFVATCKSGHLEEFPWKWFVHGKLENPRDCDGRELFLDEGPSGDFSEIVVRCGTCGARRSLADAREDRVLPDCGGYRPWLGEQGQQPECHEKLHLLSRFASNAYFTQVESALSIPEKGRDLERAVATSKLWPLLGDARDAATVRLLRKVQKIIDESLGAITNRPATDFSDQEIADAVNAVHGGGDTPRDGLRTAEFKQFLGAKDEIPGELPPEEDDFFACRLVPTNRRQPTSVATVESSLCSKKRSSRQRPIARVLRPCLETVVLELALLGLQPACLAPCYRAWAIRGVVTRAGLARPRLTSLATEHAHDEEHSRGNHSEAQEKPHNAGKLGLRIGWQVPSWRPDAWHYLVEGYAHRRGECQPDQHEQQAG